MRRLIPLLCLGVILTGCSAMEDFYPNRREIDEIEYIHAVAVDKSSENPDLIRVTVTAKKEKEAGGGKTQAEGKSSGDEPGSALVLVSEAETIFKALRKFQTYGDRQIFWGHAKFLIMGEEAAREDISKYLDFFSRTSDFRNNSYVYIAKGTTGEEILNMSNVGKFYIPDKLNNMRKDTGYLSISGEVQLMDIMAVMGKSTSDVFIPTVYIAPVEFGREGGTQIPPVRMDGYGVIKDFKLVDYLSADEARCFNFITDRVKSGVITVKEDKSGSNVAMEITQKRIKIIPQLESGSLKSIKIKIDLRTALIEQQGRVMIFDEKNLNKLEEKQSEVVRKEVEKAIEKVQKYKADIFDIGWHVHYRHPVIWESIKGRWNEIFKDLKFDIEVNTTIRRTYNIREPNGYKKVD